MSRKDDKQASPSGRPQPLVRPGGKPLARSRGRGGGGGGGGGGPTIQVIDLGGAGAGGALALPAAGAGAGAGPARPAGINVLGAVLRRWWLVLLVAAVLGGGGFLLAGRVVKPTFEARALVLYHPVTPASTKFGIATDPTDVVRTQIELLTKPEVALLAARNPELQQALPFLKGLDLDNPAVQKDVARKLRGICSAVRIPDTELVEVYAEKPEAFVAAAVANAFADAFVEHCITRLQGRDGVQRKKLEQQVAEHEALLNSLIRKKSEIEQANNFLLHTRKLEDAIARVQEFDKLLREAGLKRMALAAELERYRKNAGDTAALPAKFQLERRRRIEEEKGKDSILQWAVSEQVTAYGELTTRRGEGKTDQHFEVIQANKRIERAQKAIAEREAAIAAAIDKKIAEEQALTVTSSLDEAQAKYDEADKLVKDYERVLATMDTDARKLAQEQQKLDRINDDLMRVRRQYDDLWSRLQGLNQERTSQDDAVVMVAERADIPPKPSEDKRVKVQAASVVGGLFIGILMALAADRFDRRLRNPRDLEPMLGAPVLGLIPRIGELKKAKGDSARALLAEEFRLIRTQLLFGHPDRSVKTIVVTSPAPGDGKTSLAVNLAISLAKAGRRVLLVDSDLRKPDVHRIFAVPDVPGLADILQEASDLNSAVRRSDIENLDVLPAGEPQGRPAEILSRPQTAPLLQHLADLYDHVVIDSAPLLPVSDTHVLLGLVDGVLCSFNADVDRDAVAQVEAILKRCNARVLGSVMNQVRYRQTSAYERGKSAYSSYYSDRRPVAAASTAVPPSAVTAALEDRSPSAARAKA